MKDQTENIRRIEQAVINHTPAEALPEEQWTTQQLQEEFDVLGFMAPYIVVQRKSDGQKGSLMFKHSPRVYFNWQED